jgi:CRISPR-associated endonuclease/helicase Cas3
MFELFRHQEEMSKPMKEKMNAFLRAPCGSGKTLAIVYNWLEERPTPHLIYVLPTKTLLRGIERDIVKILSDTDLPYKYVELEEKRFGNNEEISIATDYGERRETSLYAHDIVLTTLDSYVSRLYRSSLTPRRYRDFPIARILNSTSVFDEAHMYDNYTHTLMKYVLEFLRGGEAHHVVMTATMNEEMIGFLELDDYYTIRVPPEYWLSFTGYKRLEELMNYENDGDIADKIREIIERNNIRKALIVCNTVGRAQNVFKKLRDMYDNVVLLHSRFKPQDRNNREREAFEISEKEEGFIVATQVVEAGLDISFPNLITDISPGDSLVQRMGRCARKKGEKGEIFIMRPSSEQFLPYSRHGIESVAALMKDFPIEQSVSFENHLVNTVATPNLKGMAESRARGLILSVFDSVSSFGDSWVSVPTRDATPIYVYFGKIEADKNPLDTSVRVDLRFLYSVSRDLKAFKFYERIYDEGGNIRIRKIPRPAAWSIAISKTLTYDECLGVIRHE